MFFRSIPSPLNYVFFRVRKSKHVNREWHCNFRGCPSLSFLSSQKKTTLSDYLSKACLADRKVSFGEEKKNSAVIQSVQGCGECEKENVREETSL